MQNSDNRFYTVREDPRRIIAKCRSHSEGTLRGFLIGFVVINALLNWVPSILSVFYPLSLKDLYRDYISADPYAVAELPDVYVVVLIYSFLLAGLFSFAGALYTLTYVRNRSAELRCIAESWQFYGKAFLLYLAETLIISLGLFLFIVPGIIAALNLSQTYYILADDPSKSVTQIIGESSKMMLGNKMSYIKLMFFYLPYIILAYLPALLIPSIVNIGAMGFFAVTIFSFALDIPIFLLTGYIAIGRGTFYELILNGSFQNFKYLEQDAFRNEAPEMWER